MEAAMPGSPMTTVANVTRVSFASPPASLLNLPPSCAGVKAPPTPAELIADETGDDGANFANAFNGPGTDNSCRVTLRVVDAKTMAPIPHVQVAIDTTYNQNDPNPPHYNYGVGANGIMTFSGGGLHEITSTVHNGVVALNNLPSYFNLDVNVIEQPGRTSVSGLVYKQCFSPDQVLLWIVKDRGQPDESSDVLWVKGGRLAVPPSH